MLDDQPVWLKTRGKPIVNVPYTQECNDVAMMLIQHHQASEYYDRAIDQFEQIYADAADGARVMALVVHPYIMGAPHRLKYFRKIFENIRKKPGVAVLDRRADFRLVSQGRAEGAVSASVAENPAEFRRFRRRLQRRPCCTAGIDMLRNRALSRGFGDGP